MSESVLAALYEQLHDHELLTPLDSKWDDAGDGVKEAFRIAHRKALESAAPWTYDKDAAQAAVRALLKAGGHVRGGFMHWLKGAPSHVLAELLTVLDGEGWHLYYDNALRERLR